MGHHSDEKSKKRKHEHKEKDRKKKSKHRKEQDADDEDMWAESNIDVNNASTSNTSTTQQNATAPAPSTSTAKRDEWMLEPSNSTVPTLGTSQRSESDFFSSIGLEHKKKAEDKKIDPNAPPPISSKELNPELRGGSSGSSAMVVEPTKVMPGGPGSQWRMMRLRKVYETAEEENRPIEEVAIERFGSLAAFEEVKEERRILDEREGRKRDSTGSVSGGVSGGGAKGFMFSDSPAGSLSRTSSFRKPNAGSTMGTPPPPTNPRVNSIRTTSVPSPLSQQSRSPIPSALTPPVQARTSTTKRSLSPSSLNRLQAKALRAKLMGDPNAEKLAKEYEEEAARAASAPETEHKVHVIPTLDSRGRMYDIGGGGAGEKGKEPETTLPGNRRRKEKVETRDPKTGEIVRYNADDDTTTLEDMIRQEKMGAGMADQKNLDAQFANAIMTDAKFENDLEYIDDNAEKLGRRKMRTDAMKRQFAIHDYARTQKALASCQFCFGEDDSPPKAPVVAMGTRVYLSSTLNEELVPGHCLIVPIQHHLTMLEGDDDVWDEVRNFMKCLMRMFAEQDKGVIFYETVKTLKWQKHTFIECVPLPWSVYEDIPAYFKESILASELEWSQHKKLIDFSARPGGFRRAMVPNLPYFMVQFDHKGEKGYGHVIEGTGNAAEEDENGMDEGEKGGGEFPRHFAGEIIGNVLELEPRKWLKPRRIDQTRRKERVKAFKAVYDKFDWTGMIE